MKRIALGLELASPWSDTADLLGAGTEELAESMIREARRFGVPIVEDNTLARRVWEQIDSELTGEIPDQPLYRGFQKLGPFLRS